MLKAALLTYSLQLLCRFWLDVRVTRLKSTDFRRSTTGWRHNSIRIARPST